MNINSLELKEYKNYKVLCEVLEEPIKTGKSKQLQLQDWERYFLYNKQGNKFIIDKIYDEPNEKVNNKGKNPNSHHNQSEGLYAPLVYPLLKSYLRYAYTQEDNHILYTTNNQLGKQCGFFGTDYQYANSHVMPLLNVMRGMEYQKIYYNKSVYDFLKFTQNYKQRISDMLTKMQKESKIEFEYDYIISWTDKTEYKENDEGMKIYKTQSRTPYDNERIIIEHIKNEIYEELEVESRKDLICKNLLNKYYMMFDNRAKKEIDFCDKCYMGYKIKMLTDFTEDGEDLLPTDKAPMKTKLHEIFCKRIMESGENKKKKFLEEIKDVWGELSMDMKKREYVRSPLYASDLKYLCKYILSRNNSFHIEQLIREDMKELDENAKLIKEFGWDKNIEE